MTQRKHMATVRIDILNKDGTVYLSSNDVPGLWLWGKDYDRVFDSLIPTLKALYEHNEGAIVDIQEAPSAQTKTERWFAQDQICQTYEIFKIGNAGTQASA